MGTLPLTDSQRRLVEENIRLATYVAKRFTGVMECAGLDFDELFSLACIGLCHGARLYDPEVSKPSTYLCRCCETAILQELRKLRRQAQLVKTVSLDAPVGHLENDATLGDILEDLNTDVESEAIAHMVLSRIEEEATAQEQTVMQLYASGMRQMEIAPIVGVSQSYVSRILAKMRRRANEALTESDGRECNAAIDCRAEANGRGKSAFSAYRRPTPSGIRSCSRTEL